MSAGMILLRTGLRFHEVLSHDKDQAPTHLFQKHKNAMNVHAC
jgi:hypothetical protein